MFTKAPFFAVLATVMLLAGGCVQVEENLITNVNKPQIDQVAEPPVVLGDAELEVVSVESATGTSDEMASGTEATTTEIMAEELVAEAETPPAAATVTEEGSVSERYCKRYGGIYTEVHSPDETWGACYFDDGSMCEILSFMRGECSKGGCKEMCRNIGTRSEGWYESCTNKLIRWADCGE